MSPRLRSGNDPAAAARGEAKAWQASDAGSGLGQLRQLVACALVFLLSSRLPPHLQQLAAGLSRSGAGSLPPLATAAATVLLDGFGVLCALYLSHTRLRGVSLWHCYPPQRLIPLSLHFTGLLAGLLNLSVR